MIVLVCSECEAILGYHVDGKDEIIESHGMCPECYAAYNLKLDQWEREHPLPEQNAYNTTRRTP